MSRMPFLPKYSITLEMFALPTGKLQLPDRWIFEDGDQDLEKARQYSPYFSFLIIHPLGKKVLFDLGLRKVGFLTYALRFLAVTGLGPRKQP